MSEFERNSAFGLRRGKIGLQLDPYSPGTSDNHDMVTATTKVNNEDLEEWYRTLDTLARDANSVYRKSSVAEEIGDLRDSVYRYLRG